MKGVRVCSLVVAWGGFVASTGCARPSNASPDAAGADSDANAAVTADAAPRADARPNAPQADAGVGGDPDTAWDPLPPLGDGAWVRVRNKCSFPLWIHGQGAQGVLQPDDAQLDPMQTRDYEAPAEWSAARVTAFKDGPRAGEIEKAEMTLQRDGSAVRLNYNITYVDWVGLPMRVSGAGGNCNDGHIVGCFRSESALLAGCPGPLSDGDKCQSARSYCLNPAHAGDAYCHAQDGKIAECVNTVPGCAAFAGAGTPQVYACSGQFSEEPRLCAALNRGMLDAPDDADHAQYYDAPPFNTYAAWVHDECPGIYAFSYDDWLGQGGFRACTGSELRITFCPGG